MGKRFFYEFSGNVYIEADDQAEAEKLATEISLEDYLLDEHLHEVDENYISFDLQKRTEQLGTDLHPFDDQDEYLKYKIRKRRYGDIFKEFLNGRFDKDELIKRMAEADKENLDDYAIVDEIDMVDLESKKLKGVRHCFID